MNDEPNQDDEVQFKVLVDNCSIEATNFESAIAVLVSSYWVFDKAFPPSLKNTLSLLARFVLNLRDFEVPPRVVRFINKIV